MSKLSLEKRAQIIGLLVEGTYPQLAFLAGIRAPR